MLKRLGFICIILSLCIAAPSFAGDRVYGYIVSGTQGAYSTLANKRRWQPNPCFPYSCNGVGPTLKNPDPNARKPQNLTACIYGADATLIYEREGKTCPYKYVDANVQRVERRRLEYLQSLNK